MERMRSISPRKSEGFCTVSMNSGPQNFGAHTRFEITARHDRARARLIFFMRRKTSRPPRRGRPRSQTTRPISSACSSNISTASTPSFAARTRQPSERFAQRGRLVRAGKNDEGNTGRLGPGQGEGIETVRGRAVAAGQNEVDRPLHCGRAFGQGADAYQFVLERAILSLGAVQVCVGLIGFEMNNLQ